MTTSPHASIGAGTQPSETESNLPPLRKTRLRAECRLYLQQRARLEALDNETDRLVRSLGKISTQIAKLLGPQDRPILVDLGTDTIVINVAEGLLIPKQTTATITVVTTAEDVLGEAVVAMTQEVAP